MLKVENLKKRSLRAYNSFIKENVIAIITYPLIKASQESTLKVPLILTMRS